MGIIIMICVTVVIIVLLYVGAKNSKEILSDEQEIKSEIDTTTKEVKTDISKL